GLSVKISTFAPSPRLSFALVLPLSLAAASCGGGAQDGVQTIPPSSSAAPSSSASVSVATSAAPSATPSAQPSATAAVDDGKWITPGPAFDSSPLFADQKLDAIARK